MNKRLKKKYNKLNHKYLTDIGIKLSQTPYGFCPNDSREKYWQHERNTYGFDERECWGVRDTFFYWLYERLMKYNEDNCINTSFHKFNIKGVEMTQQECIDKMIYLCKKYITKSGYMPWKEEDKLYEEVTEVFDILKECIWCLWW